MYILASHLHLNMCVFYKCFFLSFLFVLINSLTTFFRFYVLCFSLSSFLLFLSFFLSNFWFLYYPVSEADCPVLTMDATGVGSEQVSRIHLSGMALSATGHVRSQFKRKREEFSIA